MLIIVRVFSILLVVVFWRTFEAKKFRSREEASDLPVYPPPPHSFHIPSSFLSPREKKSAKINIFFFRNGRYSMAPRGRNRKLQTKGFLFLRRALSHFLAQSVCFPLSKNCSLTNELLDQLIIQTFNLSRTDRIGHLITKTFDLMQTIIRDGPNAEVCQNSSYAMSNNYNYNLKTISSIFRRWSMTWNRWRPNKQMQWSGTRISKFQYNYSKVFIDSLKILNFRSDVFRSILYDLSSSLGSMVESIQERNITENSNETFQGTFNDVSCEE